MENLDLEHQRKLMEAQQWALQSGIDPANFAPDELLAMYMDYEGKRGTLDKQRAQSTALRDMTTQNLGGTQAGGIYVADSPWEGVAAAAGTIKDAMNQSKISKEENVLSDMNAKARAASARELSNAIRGVNGPASTMGAPPQSLTPEQVEQMNRRRRGMVSA